MKTLFISLFLFTGFKNAYACMCVKSEERLIQSIAEFQQIPQEHIYLTNFKESYNLVYALPNAIRISVNRDRECELSCSLKGTRLSAYIYYYKNGLSCEALAIKPARKENHVVLKNIICD